MARRYELTAKQWRRIAPLLPEDAVDPGPGGVDDRQFVNGVLWVLRSGADWRDLPARYGEWTTLHARFARWAEAGVWARVFEDLIKDPDNAYVALDAELVRTHQ